LSKGQRSQLPGASLGTVSAAQGLKGALKLRADREAATTDPEVIKALKEVVIAGRCYQVLKAQRLKTQVLLSLKGIDTRTQAEQLVGQKVLAERHRFPPLPPGEYYWFQVLGLPVLNAADRVLLGYLEEIIPTPAHDVYVVRQGTREVLLPAVEEVIVQINLEEGYLLVSPPPGLLEAYAD